LGLPFSAPAKLIISAVGVIFWQARQIAINALLSLAEKPLGMAMSCIDSIRMRSVWASRARAAPEKQLRLRHCIELSNGDIWSPAYVAAFYMETDLEQ
jgi:hypothetical protein